MDDPVLQAKPILDRFMLDGKIALVTGGAQGIGRGFAHALGDAGAAVALVDLDRNKALQVVGELKRKNIDAIAVRADITRRDEIKDAIRAILDEWGELTIAVNNAGLCIWGDAETLPMEDWDKTFNLNLRGLFMCSQEEAKVMLESGYGKIINTASMSAHIVNTPQHQAAYNASKAGVIHLTRSMAIEWAKRGVRVNSISPGYTRTKLVIDLLQKPEGKSFEPIWVDERTPMSRMAEVTDLQGAVVFLASPASDFITGQDIIIDGGYCCW
ncbi:SDR family oxidoreductase [Candidatus Bathyarchaeota archaeon]|nr:SDR family oxidoreductase [Candidatus Bathyarchaeota archaeon]